METTAADYLEKHNIYGLFEDLMQQLIIHKPDDPLDFLISQLNKPEVLKVIIVGPPASGKGTQCELIVQKYGLVHVSTGDLLREEVRNNTELGQKVKKYLDSGTLVPDDVIISITLQKLNSPECQEKGWLLDGFPRTKAQALALQSHGIFPDKCILLNIVDDVVIERVSGRRVDPVTNQTYHIKFNPPPADETILNRLEQRSDDTEEKMVRRLAAYHANLEGIRKCFASVLCGVDANQHKDTVFEHIHEFLDKSNNTHNSKGPRRPPRLFIVGPPGSGRRTQAKLVSVKHNLVLISIPELLRAAGIPGTPNDEEIASLLAARINEKDCISQGWAIAGFPISLKQAEAFQQAGILPSRVVHFEVPDEVAKERVTHRRVDPKTGIFHDMKTNYPADSAIQNRLVQHPDDTEEAFAAHLKEYRDSIAEIKTFYGAAFKSVDGRGDIRTTSELLLSILF